MQSCRPIVDCSTQYSYVTIAYMYMTVVTFGNRFLSTTLKSNAGLRIQAVWSAHPSSSRAFCFCLL